MSDDELIIPRGRGSSPNGGDHHRPINDDDDEDDHMIPLNGLGALACCNPYKPLHRFIVLIPMCFLSFGSYFCYDNPAALQNHIKSDMNVNTGEFMSLYAWYSWPNVILCFFGGFLIDRLFGIRLGSIVFSTFVLVGQLIFASGALFNKFWLMDVGRFVFGIGGESLAVAQNTYAVSWFKGKELNMVFGLQLSLARVGSTVNMNVMQPVYNIVAKYYKGNECLGYALLIAASMCVFSFTCAVILGFFDKRAERILRKQETSPVKETIRITDVKDFSAAFWLITIVCVTYYVALFPFIGLGAVFFKRKFTPYNANMVDGSVYVISAIASPVFGILVDRTGRNLTFVVIAVGISFVCHSLLAFTFLNPYIAMGLYGLSYSMLASGLWPMVSLVIPDYQLGTAYGVMQSIQNLGLALMSMAAGNIVDVHGYFVLEIVNLGCLVAALVSVAALFIVDHRMDCKLNISSAERRRLEEAAKARDHLEREQLLRSDSLVGDISPHDLLNSLNQ